MAWHQDRKRVSAEGLPDCPRGVRCAEPSRDLAVGERCARRNLARRRVDPAMERRHALHGERPRGEIARVPAQQRGDALDCSPHRGRRRRFARLRETPRDTRARCSLVRLRKLHGKNDPPAPGDGTAADGRIEQGKSLPGHLGILAPCSHAALGESCCGPGRQGGAAPLAPMLPWLEGTEPKFAPNPVVTQLAPVAPPPKPKPRPDIAVPARGFSPPAFPAVMPPCPPSPI